MEIVENRIRIKGVSEAARRLGVSKCHLSYVIRGLRDSKRLRARAKAMGIKLPRMPKAV